MHIVIKFRNDVARQTEYFLRHKYNSKASLEKLAKAVILKVAAEQAAKELIEPDCENCDKDLPCKMECKIGGINGKL
jgi:hypothetical protein